MDPLSSPHTTLLPAAQPPFTAAAYVKGGMEICEPMYVPGRRGTYYH